MEERYGSLKTYLEAPRWAGIKKFLYDIEQTYHCELTILDHEKGLLTELIKFKFEGYESNLNKLNKAIRQAMEEYNKEPFISDKYSVKDALFETDSLNVKVLITAKKWSKVKKLAEDAAKYYDLESKISEKGLGLLNKQVVIEVKSETPSKINKFKSLVEDHLKTKNIVFTETSLEKKLKFR